MHELKFLLDADLPRSSAEVLRALDFDAKDVRELINAARSAVLKTFLNAIMRSQKRLMLIGTIVMR
jgi:hypothetical protein